MPPQDAASPIPVEHRVQVALLGPLVVTVGGDEVRVPGRLARAALTVLALEAGRFVSSSTLIDRLWEEPPASARNTLQTYLSHLRRALDPAGAGHPPALERTGDAYRLDGIDVDVARFESLLGAAAGGAPDAIPLAAEVPDRPVGTARDRLVAADSALALWRGDPLADLGPSSFAEAERTRLGELLRMAQTRRVEALLGLGDHGAAIASAAAALDAHPYDEALWALAILARYRAGRPADALATYQRARRVLAEDLGLTPSARLQALERAVLAGDSTVLTDAPLLGAAALDPTAPDDSSRDGLRQLRLVIGEDDLLVREGLQRILERYDDLVVLAVGSTRDEVIDAVDRCRPDVLLTDIRMPPCKNDEGIEIARGLHHTQPDVGVVLLSQCADPCYARALFSPTSARRGYLLKEHLGRPNQLVSAIRTVADGGSYVDPGIVDLLVAPAPLETAVPR